MKKVCLLLVFYCQTSPGQNIAVDSLLRLIAVEKVDSQKLKLYNQLVLESYKINLQTAIEYARQGVKLAETIDDKIWTPKLYETRGRMHANLSQLDSANMFYEKAMAIYNSTNNKKGQASIFQKFAFVHRRKGDFQKAMDADLKSLRIMEGLNDSEGLARAYEAVSDDLTRQKKLTEAMDYAKKAIAICEKNNLKEEMPYALFNAGNVSIAMGNNKESLDYYSKTLEIADPAKLSPGQMASFINSRGNAYKKLSQYQLALNDYNKTLSISKQANFGMGIYTAIANLGEVNLLLGNYKEALGYQLETVRLQERDGDLINLTENYRHVSTIYEKMGDYKQALEYQRKAGAMRDSVASIKSDTAMSRLLTQYETEKKEATIAAQQTQLSQQKKVQWLSIGVAVLLAGFLVFIYRSLRNRSKTNKLLAAKNAENELLLKEIHHRVKNNLEIVSSLLELQSAQIDDPNTKEAMQDGQNRVHSIGIVHQKLYQGETLGSIEMKDYFINLSESILNSFGAEGRVNIEFAMEKLNMDIDTAVPLGLIVNELLTNTLKYAFPNNQNGSVRIKLEKQPSGILHLEVSDNGVGKSGITHGTGFGGQLISLLTRQLNGSMKEENNNGTQVFFDFKLEKVA